MTNPKIKPCPKCGCRLDVYKYESGWCFVECNNCFYCGPGEGSQRQAIKSHNEKISEIDWLRNSPMAHGFCCKRCGFQETPHTIPEHYPGVCEFYVSPDAKTEGEIWAEERKREAERESYKYRGPAYEH